MISPSMVARVGRPTPQEATIMPADGIVPAEVAEETRATRGLPRHPKFEGNCEAMKGHVDDVLDH